MLFNNTNMRTAMAYTNAVGDKVYPIIVDIKKGIKSTEEVSFVSSDINTGVLSVAFIQGNDTYNVEGAEVICSIMRPDTTTLEIPCNIINGNTIEVPLGVNGTSQDGVYSFDFKVFKGGNKIVGTPIMNYSVSLSISNDLVVEEDDRLPVLTMLMTQVNELKEETRETINQANIATEATKVATNNAIEATNKANETVSKVTQDTAKAIADVNATSDTMVENVNNAISNMSTTVNSKISEMTDTVNDKISEVNTAKNEMINDVSSTKANMVNEVTNAKNEMTATVTNKVSEVEGRFNALTASQQQSSEVIDARDGETSLKARLDRDIEKAKQVYVNVEGSHISTDSSVGYAKDVEILGNTIQDASNLADIRSVGDKVEGQELYEIPVLSSNARIQKMDGTNPVKNTLLDIPHGSYVYELDENFNIISNSSGHQLSFLNNNFEQVDFFTMSKNPRQYTFAYPKEASYIKYASNNKVKYIAVIDELDLNYKFIEDKLTILSPVQLEKGDILKEVDGVWGVDKNIVDTIITGNESNTSLFTCNDGVKKYFGFVKPGNIYNIKNGIQYYHITNKLKNGNAYNGEDNVFWLFFDGSNTQLRIRLDDSYTTKEQYIEWLKSNNILVKYITTQPQFIPLPHDQQIKLRTFANKTNISFLTEIEGTIKAQVPKSLGATVNTHTEQISNLNKELDRVKKLEESTVSTVTTESDFTTVEATSNGYFEDVKLEGKTLVNLAYKPTNNGVINNQYASISKVSYIKPATEYTYVIRNNGSDTVKLYLNNQYCFGWHALSVDANSTIIGKATSLSTINGDTWLSLAETQTTEQNLQVMLLEGDHTQNPPNYFEGLKSVGQSGTTSEDGADEIVVSSVKGDGNLIKSRLVFGDNEQVEGFASVYRQFKIPVIKGRTYYLKAKVQTNSNWKDSLCRLYHQSKSGVHTVFYDSTRNTNNSLVDIDVSFVANDDYVVFEYYNNPALDRNKNIYDNFDYLCLTSNPNLNPNTDLVSDKKRLLYYNEETQTWEKPILREWDSIEKHADSKYYYHQRSAEVVFNGSENWGLNAGWSGEEMSTNSYYLTADGQKTAGLMIKSNGATNIISEVMPTVFINGTSFDSDCVSGENYSGAIYIRINKSKVLSGIKPYLQQNPMRVVYQLAEEKVYECTNIDLITYANETNFIVNSGAIAPRTTLKVHNNISNVVRILQEKVSLLENKFIEGLKKVLAGDMYSLAELLYPEDFVEENPENNIMLLPLE